LQDIAANNVHPVSGKSFAELWQAMSDEAESELKLA
jgi:hypothetical protein